MNSDRCLTIDNLFVGLRPEAPKVQGALDVHFASPVPAVLEPLRISPERYGFTRRANGEAKRTQGRQVSYSVFNVRHTLH